MSYLKLNGKELSNKIKNLIKNKVMIRKTLSSYY